MRICLVTETLSTGVGRHILDLAVALESLGHLIHVIYSPFRADPWLVERLHSHRGIRVSLLPMRRRPHPTDIGVLIRLAIYLRRQGPFDAVHGHSSKAGALVRLLRPLIPGRIVYTPHAFITMSPGLGHLTRIFYGTIERLLAYLAHKIICTSRIELAHACQLGLPMRKLALVPNGINPPPDETGSECLHLPPNTTVFGYVGRFDFQKAPDELVRAACILLRRGHAAHFVLVGDGPLRASLRQTVSEVELDHAFTWIGAVEAAPIMRQFDAIVLPSRYEGFSYVLIEALSCGLPILTTPVGGAAETVSDGENGYIVPIGDAPSLARRMEQIIQDPPRRRRMAQQSRERFILFTRSRMAKTIERLYRRENPRAVNPPASPTSPAYKTD
jgi:glycosyltransferase involved in cell wall biosynthesis